MNKAFQEGNFDTSFIEKHKVCEEFLIFFSHA